MQQKLPDFQGAKKYALARLENELNTTLSYHDLRHTRDDVMPAAVRLAGVIGISEIETNLLEVAAAFHDIGFLVRNFDNEIIGVEIAIQTLPNFGFEPAQIQVITDVILATKLPHAPQNLLQQIIADADLDVLGRDDFSILNVALRRELEASDQYVTDQEWYQSQLQFLRNHTYFTNAAKSLRDEGKKKNVRDLKRLLAVYSIV